MKYATVIFDLDGTISDPFTGISKSVNYALDRQGFETVDARRIRHMIGPPLTEIFTELVGAIPEQRMLDLVASYRERYADVGYAENLIYDDIPELLATLSAREISLGICTSKRVDFAERIVDMFGLTHHFDFVDGGDVHVTKSMQLERLVANGIDAGTAIMIGDRAVDIQAARANGLDSIGVCWGFADEGELQGARPEHLVRAPLELLELFA